MRRGVAKLSVDQRKKTRVPFLGRRRPGEENTHSKLGGGVTTVKSPEGREEVKESNTKTEDDEFHHLPYGRAQKQN